MTARQSIPVPAIHAPAIRVPVLTVCGFLGAGKTTLVNRVLRHADGRRIIVFVNDFGAINIDYDLVETVEADRISLKNGCVCCTLNEDLVKGVADFVRQEQRPDAIVIEASGISNPSALDASLGTLEAAGLIRADAKLYVLDAAAFDDLDFHDAEVIIDHAAVNDIVLLNKTDIVSQNILDTLRGLLAEAAPFTSVVETAHCDIAVDLILGFDHGLAAAADRSTNPRHAPTDDDHPGRYRTWSYETDRLLERARFDRFAKTLSATCLRAKGILRFSDAPAVAQLFNLVGYRASLEPKTDTGTLSRLVVIGLAEKIKPAKIEPAFVETLSNPG